MVYHNNIKDIESPAVVCILDTIEDFSVQVGHETTFANSENHHQTYLIYKDLLKDHKILGLENQWDLSNFFI